MNLWNLVLLNLFPLFQVVRMDAWYSEKRQTNQQNIVFTVCEHDDV